MSELENGSGMLMMGTAKIVRGSVKGCVERVCLRGMRNNCRMS